MIDIAKAGGGIGIFPRPMVRGEVASGALAPIDGMPALAPVEFHVAMRVADTEPVLTQIFQRAAKLNLAAVLVSSECRSEENRVGEGWVSQCKTRWATYD